MSMLAWAVRYVAHVSFKIILLFWQGRTQVSAPEGAHVGAPLQDNY